MTRPRASARWLAATIAALALAVLPAMVGAAAPARGRVRMIAPSTECPEAGRRLPDGASRALAIWLGAGATALCLGDLNDNGRREVLAAVTDRSYGKGMGFYWVTRRAGIFEEARGGPDPWEPLLLTSDRIENPARLVGWKTPVTQEGIGLRYTMTDAGRICLQFRRLDTKVNRIEDPLVLVRWDPTVERYEQGRCADGMTGRLVPAR